MNNRALMPLRTSRCLPSAAALAAVMLLGLPQGVAAQQPPATPAAQVPAAQPSPTQTFDAYRKALAGAKSYADVTPYMEATSRSMIEGVPEGSRGKMFELLKKFAGTFTEVKVTKETITGDTAVLDLTGKDPKGQTATGSVPMTKEATGWKVGPEQWSSAPR